MNVLRVALLTGALLIASEAVAVDDLPRCPCRFVDVLDGGAVIIKPGNRTLPAELAKPGRLVSHGDLLEVSGAPAARLRCATSVVPLNAPPTMQPVPCARPSPSTPEKPRPRVGIQDHSLPGEFPRLRDDSRLTTHPNLKKELMVLSPRATNETSVKPAISWTTVPGVESYEITIRGEGKEFSKQVIAQRKAIQTIEYPPDWPALTRTGNYKAIVSTASLSSEDGKAFVGFGIISQEEAAAVKNELAMVDQWNLSPRVAMLTRADILTSRKLYTNAIQTLSPLMEEGDPEAMRSLADLYLRIRLPQESERILLRLANNDTIAKRDSVQGQVKTLEVLSELLAARGDEAGAQEYRNRARDLLKAPAK